LETVPAKQLKQSAATRHNRDAPPRFLTFLPRFFALSSLFPSIVFIVWQQM
jgi:hypothetical protein